MKKKSVLTTASGIVAALAAIAFIAMSWYTTKEVPSMEVWFGAIFAAATTLGLIAARDDKVSSEGTVAAKAKKPADSGPYLGAVILMLLLPSLLLSGCAVNQSPGQKYRTASRSHEAAVKTATALITQKVITNKNDIKNILIGARAGDKLLDEIEADVIAGREFNLNWKLNKLNKIIGVIIQKTLEANRKEDPADDTSNRNRIGPEVTRRRSASIRSGKECVRAIARIEPGRNRDDYSRPQRSDVSTGGSRGKCWSRRAA